MRILYVEDNPEEAVIVQQILDSQREIYDLEVASSQAEARIRILSLARDDFDVILINLNLADGSGIKLLHDIRRRELPVAVVTITEQRNEHLAHAALKAGADDYIVKMPDYYANLPRFLTTALKHHKENKTRRTLPIRVLYAEHNPEDSDLTLKHMENFAPHIHLEIVRSVDEVLQRLKQNLQTAPVDLLLLDLHLQAGLNVIKLVKAVQSPGMPLIPLVILTNPGGQTSAVQVLNLGVSDFLIKQSGYLHRLPLVIENAYSMHQLEKEREALFESEERFRRLAENAHDIIFRIVVQPEIRFEYLSPAFKQITGFLPEELYQNSESIYKILNMDPRQADEFMLLLHSSTTGEVTFPIIDTHEMLHWLEMRSTLILDESNGHTLVEGVCRDITLRKQAEEKIHNDMMKLNGLHLIDSAISSSFDLRLTLRLFTDQAVALLETDAADVVLFEPDLSTPKVFISVGFRQTDPSLQGTIRNFAFPDSSILERKVIHLDLDQAKEKSRALFNIMTQEEFEEYWASPLMVKGQIKGILEIFQRKHIARDNDWIAFLEMLSQQASIAYENNKIFEKLQRTNQDLLRAYDETLAGWVNLLDLRDRETEGHTLRVLDMTIRAAEVFNIHGEDLANMRRGVLLHDIGKVGVPDTILNKPGPLTEEEWQIMRQHPKFAYDMLSQIEYLRPALDIPYCHHEHWNGTGYPRGLAGSEIPLAARIFSVIDTFDALVSNRPYRVGVSVKRALDYLHSQAGKQYDAEVVEKCIPVLLEFQPFS